MNIKIERYHETYEKRDLKFERRGLREYMFDFSNTPDVIQTISPQFRDYNQNCRGGSLGQVEAVDLDDVAKWRQNLI